MTGREFHWIAGGRETAVRLEGSRDHGTFHTGETAIPFRLLDSSAHTLTLEIDGHRRTFHIVRDRDQYSIWHNGRTYQLSRVHRTALSQSGAVPGSTGDITALMPGKILRIEVSVGDTVEEKQTLAIMESMKMETALKAPRAGRVDEIHCQTGQVVDMGQLLITIV
jgi:biotin carboxyl carrier protein